MIDYAIFPFPDIEPAYSNAVLGAGNVAVAFTATAETESFFNFLITTDAAETWIAAGNASPNRSVDFRLYGDPNLRAAAQRMANASIVRYDLSDQLPVDLNLYMWSLMDDLVLAALDPAAMRAVLLRMEIHATGVHSLFLPMIMRP